MGYYTSIKDDKTSKSGQYASNDGLYDGNEYRNICNSFSIAIIGLCGYGRSDADSHDPAEGVYLEKGKVIYPEKPGFGVFKTKYNQKTKNRVIIKNRKPK